MRACQFSLQLRLYVILLLDLSSSLCFSYQVYHMQVTHVISWVCSHTLCIIYGADKCINFQDVHETAAGALWNLAFNSGNALRIVEEGGVRALVDLCSSSVSKMARFMSALALSYMFDGRYAKNYNLDILVSVMLSILLKIVF